MVLDERCRRSDLKPIRASEPFKLSPQRSHNDQLPVCDISPRSAAL